MKKAISTLLCTAAAIGFVALGASCTKTGSADTSKEIKIGAILPVSGQVSTYGIQCRNAIELAFEQANAKGGVLGKKLVLIAEDDENSPDKTMNAFKKLTAQDKVGIVIGGVTSKCTLAITELAQAKKVVLISPTATNDKVTDAGDYIFRACYKDSFQGVVVGQFAVNTLKAKTAAILFDNSNDYSKGLKDNFLGTFSGAQGVVVAEESYTNGDKDFAAQITKIKESKPDVIFLPDYYPTVSLIAKQIRDQGIKVPLLGADGWDEIINNAGDEVLGCYYSNHYSTDVQDPEVQDFIAAYKAKFGEKEVPNALGALAYDSANLLIAAITAAGSTKSEAVRDALVKTSGKFVTGNISFDADRNPVKSAVMLKIVKGKDGKLTTQYTETVNP